MMKITAKQSMVLCNLHRVTLRTKGKKPVHFLNGEDCRAQINSLAAMKLVSVDDHGSPTRIGDPDVILSRRGKEMLPDPLNYKVGEAAT